MSVFLAEDTGLGADADENSMSGTDGSEDDGRRHSGVDRSGAHRLDASGRPGGSQPPPSYREADDHVQLALVESTHAEANLGLLVRGLQHLLAGAGAARDAHAALSRELGTLRDLLYRANEAEQAAMKRLRLAEETLEAFRREVALERARFIDEEDRFLAELVGDHQREVAELHDRLEAALSQPKPVPDSPSALPVTPGSRFTERLERAATEPSMQAASVDARGHEVPAPEWQKPEPFAVSDWAPQPPFSLAEFALFASAGERPPAGVEGEPANGRERDSGRPTPVEPTEGSALIDRTTGRALDPEETPLPTWQAISKLESLRAPALPRDEAIDDEDVPVATSSQKRATLPAMPPPPAPAAAPAPGDPPSSGPGQVIAVIKPRSVKIPRNTPPPIQVDEDEPEPLTVRPATPLPADAVTEDGAPHLPASDLMDTVRPPPLIKPKPDLSQRPLREYSLGSAEVAEERLDGARGPDSDGSR